MLAQAMNAELRRGGQVYYLHNRVESIEHTAAAIKDMLPDAVVGIAHGKMSEDELTFCKQAVATYKDLKPVILNGDFYRLVSPYEGNHTAVMTVDAQKNQSVLYTYNIHPRFSEDLYPIRLQGLDPNKQYRIEEINQMPGKSSGFAENGQVYSGDYLMNVGLRLFTTEDLSSHIFKLTAM